MVKMPVHLAPQAIILQIRPQGNPVQSDRIANDRAGASVPGERAQTEGKSERLLPQGVGVCGQEVG